MHNALDQQYEIKIDDYTKKKFRRTEMFSREVQGWLKAAYDFYPRARCLCKEGSMGLETVIREVKADKRYTIVRLPGKRKEHASGCVHGDKTYPSEAGDRERIPGIETELDGTAILALSEFFPRKTHGSSDKSQDDVVATKGSKGLRRDFATLLRVLWHLWSESKFNDWTPSNVKKVGWSSVRKVIEGKAGNVFLDEAKTTPLTDILYVDGLLGGGYWADDFVTVMKHISLSDNPVLNNTEGPFGILMARIVDYKIDGNRAILNAEHMTQGTLSVDIKKFARMKRSFGDEFGVIKKSRRSLNDQVVGLILVAPLDTYNCLPIKSVGLMRVTEDWIPVESSYESMIAKALVAKGRRFRKPIVYDGSGLHPDFVLLDTNIPKYYMEVSGRMEDETYRDRCEEKRKRYKEMKIKPWVWDTKRDGGKWEDWRDFPPVANNRSE